MYYVVAYDIVDNRRRTRLFKALKAFGMPAQLSVFECELDEKSLNSLHCAIEKLTNRAEDSVKVYPLCQACLRGAVVHGKGRVWRVPDIIIT